MSETKTNGDTLHAIVAKDTYAALVSLGYLEDNAREMVQSVGDRKFESVPEMVAFLLGGHVTTKSNSTIEERLKTLEARLCDVEQRRRQIEESAAKVDELASKAETKKKAATAAKNAWEEAVEMHMALCRHWSKSEEVASRPLIAACEAKADPVSADESWRDEPIEVLSACGLSQGIVETLNDSGFHTLGDLSNWSADNHGFNGIDGIGKAKATQIEDAFMRYWDARAADVQDADDDEDDTDAAEDAEAVRDDIDPEATGMAMGPFWGAEAEAELDAAQQERSGLDLVTSHPGSDPESNGVEATEPKRRRKNAKA